MRGGMANEIEEGRLSAAEYVDQLEAKYWSRQNVPPTQVVGALIYRQALRSGKMSIGEFGRLLKEFGSSQPLLSNLMMTFLFQAKLSAIFKALILDDENTGHVITSIPTTCIEHFRHPNAMAALTPHGDPFILVDAKFAACMHSMVKLLLHRARSTQQSGVASFSESSLLSDRDLAESLKRLAVYVFSEQQEALPHIPARETETFQIWGAMLVHGLETFIICHELAHHLLGHK